MLTTKQTAAAQELADIGFAYSDAISRFEIGLMTAEEYSVHLRSRGDQYRRAEDLFGTLIHDRLPPGPLGLVIEEVGREIVERINASDAGRSRSGALVFQAATTLSLACGLTEV